MEAQWATCVIEAAERSMSAELKPRAGGSTAAAVGAAQVEEGLTCSQGRLCGCSSAVYVLDAPAAGAPSAPASPSTSGCGPS